MCGTFTQQKDEMHRLSGARDFPPIMADVLITDEETAIPCDVQEGWSAKMNAEKRKVLEQLISKGSIMPADKELTATRPT